MSEGASRLIRASGPCCCGHLNPDFEVSDVGQVLVAQCCGALYLDRGTFVSLLRDWRVPMVTEYEQAAQWQRGEASCEGGAAKA